MAENNTIAELIRPGQKFPAERVAQLEIEMLKQEQVKCPVYHHFSPGLYVREVNIPAGTLAIGHRQKTVHLNIFLKGRVMMLNDDGKVIEMRAPMIFTGQPGRKAGFILDDMVWLNVYATDERDIETLEETYLDKSPGWLDAQMAPLKKVADIEDFKQAIAEYGFDEQTVREQSENTADCINFPPGTYSVAVHESPIDGRGLFATAPFKPGEIIAPARIGGFRTPAGRFTNHSIAPNAEMRLYGQDIFLVATRDIEGCRAGQKGDEITTNYRETLKMMGVKKCQV